MYSIDSFFSDVRLLSNSLVIKIHDIGIMMESQFISLANLKDTNITDWRYYKHLSGEYYSVPDYYNYPYAESGSDPKVMIKVIELEEERVLTKQLLEDYKVTKEELLKQGDYYTDLVNAYPTMITFIHACLFNIDKDIIFSAEDGTILGYNQTLVESNEYSLIQNLELFVKGFIARWRIKEYLITDALYLPSLLAILFGNIPGKIVNIRLSKIRSKEIHSFFLESYFRSRFDIWDAVNVLNKETIMWLYLNLDYLIKNIGSNETFKTLLDKVFSPNNVGIGEYIIKKKDGELIDNDMYNYLKLPFTEQEAVIKKYALNDKYVLNNAEVITVKDVLEKEYELLDTYETDRKLYLLENIPGQINDNVNGENKTKIIDISTLRTFNGFNVDLVQVLVDYWCYLLGKNQFGSFTDDNVSTAKVEFVDPNTGSHYNLTSRSGFYIFLKLLLYTIDQVDLPLSGFNISTVLDPNASLDEILNYNLFQDGYTQYLNNDIKDGYPIPLKQYTSDINVSEFLLTVQSYYKKLWILSANSENNIVMANIKSFLFRAAIQETIKIHKYTTDKTIDELLLKEGINFKIQGTYDVVLSLKELIKTVLGVEVDDNSTVKEILSKFKELLTKLSSYTKQIFGGVENESQVYTYYNSITPLLTTKGIIKLTGSSLETSPVDDAYFLSTFIGVAPSTDANIIMNIPAVNIDICDGRHSNGTMQFIYGDVFGYCYNQSSFDLLDIRYDSTRRMNTCDVKPQILEIKQLNRVNDGSLLKVVDPREVNRYSRGQAISEENDADIKTHDDPPKDLKGFGKMYFDPTEDDESTFDFED